MWDETDDILASELQKLATRATGKEVGSGAVRWVARRMPSDAATIELQFSCDPKAALQAAYETLRETGRLVRDRTPDAEALSLSGIVSSGFLGLNPSTVTIQLVPLDEQNVKLIVTGIAKEGLIKQRGGQKSAQAVADGIRRRLEGNTQHPHVG